MGILFMLFFAVMVVVVYQFTKCPAKSLGWMFFIPVAAIIWVQIQLEKNKNKSE